MTIKAFKKIPLKDKEADKLQSNIEQYVKPITSSQIIDGVLLKEVALKISVRNEVEHKLGRKPLGWIIVRKRSDSRIWDLQDTNTSPLQTISLACSHPVTVDIWVF